MSDIPSRNTPHFDWRWLAAFLLPHRAAILALMCLSLSVSLLVMLQPYFTKLLIDDGLLARDTDTLIRMALLMFAAGLLSTLLSGFNRYHYTRVSGRILFAIRERVFAHLQTLSPAFYLRHRSGDILSRLDGDVAELQRFAVDSLFAGLSGVFGLMGTVGFMLYLSPQLSFLALGLIPVQWFYLRFMRRRVQVRMRRVRERAADISAFLMERIPAIKFIQSVSAEERESQSLQRLNHAYLADLLRQQLTEFFTSSVPSNLSAAMRALIFVLGGIEVIEGRMQLGSLIAFSTYLGMAMGPLQSLLGVYMAMNRVRVSAERVQLLTTEKAAVQNSGSTRIHSPTADIVFENLGFRYPASNEWVLRHLRQHIPGGARVALCGASGSGKSTLLDLLLRHYDPDEGRILIDGVALADLDLAEWRRRIAFVAQDTVLFRGSLLDNLRYANPEATQSEVQAALEMAQLGALVARLPQGLDTAIGERGTRLSGGEKQRLSIARALLQQPLLIILDEATSAVDSATESVLISEIDRLFAHTTRLVVSHREAPLLGSDIVIALQGETGA